MFRRVAYPGMYFRASPQLYDITCSVVPGWILEKAEEGV